MQKSSEPIFPIISNDSTSIIFNFNNNPTTRFCDTGYNLFFKMIAYNVQFLLMRIVAVLLFKKYYSSSDADDRKRKSPISPAR
jgi:hypothetical protein